MARDTFRDGAKILADYEWHYGHETEDPDEKTLDLERTALTTGEGFVRQQGSPSPTIKKYNGWIVFPDQLEKMEAYYDACRGIGTPARTIFYKDVDGSENEVLITDFSVHRQVGRAGGTMLGYVWKYTITMEVIS